MPIQKETTDEQINIELEINIIFGPLGHTPCIYDFKFLEI